MKINRFRILFKLLFSSLIALSTTNGDEFTTTPDSNSNHYQTSNQQLTIAVIDIEQAISSSNAATAIEKKIDAEFKTQDVEAELLHNEIMTLLEKQKKITFKDNPKEFKSLGREIQDKRDKYDRIIRILKDRTTNRQEDLFDEIDPLIQRAIQELMQETNYDIVYRRTDLIHFDPRLDITSKLTAKLNEVIKP